MNKITLSEETKLIGILSDTHTFLDPRISEVLSGVDVILHAGDIMSNDVLEQLSNLTKQVISVAGNNDIESVWPTKHADIVNAIPEVVELDVQGQKLGLIHGHQYGMSQPDHQKLRQVFDDCRMVIYGHTHKQVIDNTESPWIINPGAAGKIRTKGGPGCLILEIENDNWQIKTFKFIDQKMAA